jgi:hypothetical protein
MSDSLKALNGDGSPGMRRFEVPSPRGQRFGNYQTKPCAVRASSRFQVQEFKVMKNYETNPFPRSNPSFCGFLYSAARKHIGTRVTRTSNLLRNEPIASGAVQRSRFKVQRFGNYQTKPRDRLAHFPGVVLCESIGPGGHRPPLQHFYQTKPSLGAPVQRFGFKVQSCDPNPSVDPFEEPRMKHGFSRIRRGKGAGRKGADFTKRTHLSGRS